MHDIETNAKANKTYEEIEGKINNSQKELDALQMKLDLKEEEVKQKMRQKEVISFWKKGFKNIKFQLLTDFADFLTNRVTQYSQSMGLDADKVEFSMPDVSSSKIDMFINIHRRNNKISSGALSDGERQRLDISCALVFNEVISKRFNLDLSTHFFDEPLTNLDKEGKLKVFELFSTMNKNAYIIDHDDSFKDRIKDVLVIKKTSDGSKIYQEV